MCIANFFFINKSLVVNLGVVHVFKTALIKESSASCIFSTFQLFNLSIPLVHFIKYISSALDR